MYITVDDNGRITETDHPLNILSFGALGPGPEDAPPATLANGAFVVTDSTAPGGLSWSRRTAPGLVVQNQIRNMDNTNSSSGAKVNLSVGGASAGDTSIGFNVNGVGDWSFGVDNSDSDTMKWDVSTTVGGNTLLSLNSSGQLVVGAAGAVSGFTAQLQVVGDGANAGFTLVAYNTSALGPFFGAAHANGTRSAPTATASSDALLRIFGGGYYVTGGPSFTTNVGRIELVATEAFTSTAQGANWAFSTTKTGTTTLSQVLLVSSDSAAFPGISVTGSTYISHSLMVGGASNQDGIPGSVSVSQTATFGGGPTLWTISGAHTGLAAEVNDVKIDMARTATFTHSSVPATQRAVAFLAPTYTTSSSTDTMTTAATVAINAAPTASGGLTITHKYALWVQAGDVLLAGGLTLGTVQFASHPNAGSMGAINYYAATDGTGAGYYAGLTSDVQWYRGGADLWQTPDSVTIDSGLNVGAATGAGNGSVKGSLSTAGSTIQLRVDQTDNTNGASNAQVVAASGGASGGDAKLGLAITGVTDWYVGIDNSASDNFIIGHSTTVGTNPSITITTGDVVSLSGGLNVGTATGAATGAIKTSDSITITSPNTNLTMDRTTSGTAGVVTVLLVTTHSTGTPLGGFGSRIFVQAEEGGNTMKDQGEVRFSWAAAGVGAQRGRVTLQASDNAAQYEGMRIEAAAAGAAAIGFLGAAAVVRQTVAAAAAAGGTGATAGAYDTAAHRDGLITLVNNMRTAGINLGLWS